jgi:hypothetical protein
MKLGPRINTESKRSLGKYTEPLPKYGREATRRAVLEAIAEQGGIVPWTPPEAEPVDDVELETAVRHWMRERLLEGLTERP